MCSFHPAQPLIFEQTISMVTTSKTSIKHKLLSIHDKLDIVHQSDATILNGKIRNRLVETVSSVVTHKKSVTKKKVRQHNVTMIGDSFLTEIRENAEASLTDKFGIYSVVKARL
jgi:hypothetical protein